MNAVKSENTMRSTEWYVCVTEGDTGAPNSQPMISTTTTTAASPGATYCVRNRIRRSHSMWKSVDKPLDPSGGKPNRSRGDVFIPAPARCQSSTGMMEARHGSGAGGDYDPMLGPIPSQVGRKPQATFRRVADS